MALIASAFPGNTLTHWPAYSSLLGSGIGAKDIGFAVAGGDVARFAARYRVARSFQGIKLAGYTTDTVVGYDSLFRVFLMWSAFERFLRVVGQTQDSIEPQLAPYKPQQCLAAIRAGDIGKTFYEFVAPRVNAEHKARISDFANNAPTNPTFLASAVRHLFAHGHLS